MTVGELDEDFYGDLRPILDGDLAAFVRGDDRHRSLTVVREAGEADVTAAARQWWDAVRADPGSVDACTAMRRAVDKWADGSRFAQLRGVLAVVRLDERGHRGVAAALDQLWSVRAKSDRDFSRLVEFARGRVITDPSPAEGIGCRCDSAAKAVRSGPAGLVGVVRAVLSASAGNRSAVLRWAAQRVFERVEAGQLDAAAGEALLRTTADQIGIPPAEADEAAAGARRKVLGG